MTKIKPTIGRVVWFYPHGHREGSLPHAAMIAFVHSDSLVNLGVLDPNGRSYNETSVSLIQDGDATPDSGRYATWMPFQIGQAKQAEIGDPAKPVTPPAPGPTEPASAATGASDVDSIEREPTNPAFVDTAAKADGESTGDANTGADGHAAAGQETPPAGE